MSKEKGYFVWYDLMTHDVEEAVNFYKEIAGWGTETWESEMGPYLMWTHDDVSLGGVASMEGKAPAETPPHWLSYVSVPDVDSTVAQAEDMGGKILHAPMDIPSVGRFAVLADPQGAALAIFRAESEMPGPDTDPEPGQFSWHELATTDHKAAFEFYSSLFDWENMEEVDMGEMGTYLIYGRDGRQMGGMFVKPAEMPGPPFWLYYIMVENIEQACDRVRSSGGTVVNGPMEVPGGDHVAQCQDPQGGFFAIHARA